MIRPAAFIVLVLILAGCGLPDRIVDGMESRECEVELPAIDPNAERSDNAGEVINHMLARYEADDIDIETGRPLFGARATAYRNRIVFESGFWDLPDDYIAGSLVHEYVHVCQRKLWGHTQFLTEYATPRGRLKLETPAYRFGQIATYRHLGVSLEFLDTYRSMELDLLHGTYHLGILDRDEYEPEVMRIWELDD